MKIVTAAFSLSRKYLASNKFVAKYFISEKICEVGSEYGIKSVRTCRHALIVSAGVNNRRKLNVNQVTCCDFSPFLRAESSESEKATFLCVSSLSLE
jgi:hypothetical protein